ncbi:MAG: bifunctional 2-polyprenyl-6-hydroxyphenol methylase/3-demethylubiquinol 3-O-methyltransferase UbiG [Gammaproteobacteria bacterium]|nr:bifunctional 2-polyprenyl-6-hydroxyphenol methylase/3-demethylubiquinol 3-O-methyltransferase UbiG [Gammaproteobacteria bacterium]
MAVPLHNSDPREIGKFGALAGTWWDPQGPSRPLHEINECRLDFIRQRTPLQNARVVDVGCGGGILTEALARHAGAVTGVDASSEVIGVAREHAAQSALPINYEVLTAEALAVREPASFDCVICMELLEHVPDVTSLLRALKDLLKPGGDLFLSTLNRSPRAWLETVVAAEYVLKLLPQGTHDYRKFVRPHELAAMLRTTGLTVREIRGMRYQPWRARAVLIPDPSVNYLVHARLD